MSRLIPLNPQDVAQRLQAGGAVLVDIREPEEFAARRVPRALSRPLSRLAGALGVEPGCEVIFMCRSGMRTSANEARLAAAVSARAFVLHGGLDAWAAAGLPVDEPRRAA